MRKLSVKKRKTAKPKKASFLDDTLPQDELQLIQSVMDDFDGDAEETDNEKTLKSQFKSAFDQLQDHAGNPTVEFRSDIATKNMQRSAYAMVLALIPVAETAYRASRKQSDANALNMFIDQARDLATDLRMVSDAQAHVDFIVRRLLDPAFMKLAQMLILEMSNIKNTLGNGLTPKQVKLSNSLVDNATRELGRQVAELRDRINLAATEYFQGGSAASSAKTLLGNAAAKRKLVNKVKTGGAR